VSGAEGDLPVPAQVAAKEFANWVRNPSFGKMNWATAERWPEIVDAIASNTTNPKLGNYLMSV
jgi:ABC-type glycerol-3-phosphate transport system substrate-binding protein